MTAFTNHSSTPAFLRAHLVTSLGTLIKCFFQIYKSKEQLSFTPIFLLHLQYCEDCICSSFPWHKSKLHSINLYFLLCYRKKIIAIPKPQDQTALNPVVLR